MKALIPVRVPAGSSQQRSSSQCPVATLPVSLCQPRLALSVAAAAAAARAISTWLTQLDKPVFCTLLSCLKLLAPLLHLLLFLFFFVLFFLCPAFFPSPTYPISL